MRFFLLSFFLVAQLSLHAQENKNPKQPLASDVVFNIVPNSDKNIYSVEITQPIPVPVSKLSSGSYSLTYSNGQAILKKSFKICRLNRNS